MCSRNPGGPVAVRFPGKRWPEALPSHITLLATALPRVAVQVRTRRVPSPTSQRGAEGREAPVVGGVAAPDTACCASHERSGSASWATTRALAPCKQLPSSLALPDLPAPSSRVFGCFFLSGRLSAISMLRLYLRRHMCYSPDSGSQPVPSRSKIRAGRTRLDESDCSRCVGINGAGLVEFGNRNTRAGGMQEAC